MDLHYKQELRVGMLVIVGVVVFTLGMLWLSGKTIGTSGTVLVPVRFANVAGLRAGDPVQVSGVKVGRVANVVLQGAGNVMVYLDVSRAQRPHAARFPGLPTVPASSATRSAAVSMSWNSPSRTTEVTVAATLE